MLSDLTIADHIVFGLLAFVLPVFAIFRVKNQVGSIPDDTNIKIKLYWLNSGVLWIGAAIIILLWVFSTRSWSEMGWQFPDEQWFPEWLILCAWFALLYMGDAMISWSSLDEHPSAQLLPKNWKEFLHFGTIVSGSAAICEEIVFRGFLVTYLATLITGPGGSVVAVVGSAVIFALLHAYQGWGATIKIFVLTILFGWIFILTHSLLPVIVLHFLVDFIGGLLGVASAKRVRSERA